MKSCSIMIIDDNATDRYLLKRMIKKLNVATEVFEADDGKIALDFLENYDENSKKFSDDFPPLLIFLDINMPVMDGFEFLEAFSNLRKTNDGYISSVFTMFTSSEREEDKLRVSSYDFVKGFIVKGSESPESLREVVDQCLGYL